MFCLQDVLFLRTIIKIIAYRVEPIFFNLFLVALVLCGIEVYVISKYFKTSFHKTRYQYVHVFNNHNSTAMGKRMLHGMWRISNIQERCFFQRILLTKLPKTGTAFWLIFLILSNFFFDIQFIFILKKFFTLFMYQEYMLFFIHICFIL